MQEVQQIANQDQKADAEFMLGLKNSFRERLGLPLVDNEAQRPSKVQAPKTSQPAPVKK